ncbi:hypothetical protein BDV95DRAFT_674236 [Massariosphaeria phaeospora]|uniref:Trm112p-domain-containing protein n=1 Tax=Massariosphaeria phaeospora TaxID=100035 RepID=A0A7C8IGH9_9PLEO|nr:hypothetical protein BDV95DRAFT_674236 [Massariosphaeria phaeospora]
MKLLTLNFLTCALKPCKASPLSFPLHPRDAELEIVESELNLSFLRNILPRLAWEELRGVVRELGLPDLPEIMPEAEALGKASSGKKTNENAANENTITTTTDEDELSPKPEVQPEAEEPDLEPTQTALDLHRLLLETSLRAGSLVCGNCGHAYKVKEGVANFLLPGHLV